MPTQANIEHVLEQAPLSSCEFSAGWNNSGWLADSIVIQPNKAKKKTFENSREELQEFQKLKEMKNKKETDQA